MRRFLSLLVLIAILSISSFIKAEETDSVILQNERSVIVTNNGKTETTTKRSIHINSHGDVEKLKTLDLNIDSKNERFELIKAARYEQLQNGDFQQDINSKAIVFSKKGLYITKIHIVMPIKKPGDKLEYEVRIIRDKPLFGNNFWNMFNLGDIYPTKHALFSISIPSVRSLYYQEQGFDSKPKIETKDNAKIYTWALNDILPMIPSSQNSSDTMPTVLISSVNTWNPIADWFSVKYHEKIIISAEIEKLSGFLLQNSSHNSIGKDMIVSVFAGYIKNNILNPSTKDDNGLLIPEDSEEIISSRKGDCKAKVVLLASLLKTADIESCPVLTNTDNIHDLTKLLPTPYYFNHAILFIPKQQGISEDMWFDPNMNNKRASDAEKIMGLFLCGKGNNRISYIDSTFME